MNQTPNVLPLQVFRDAVAQRLQQAPFNWSGHVSYDLQRRYGDLVQEDWSEGGTVEDAAQAIHTLNMDRCLPPKMDDLERDCAERESDEWEGLADTPY